MSQDQIKINRGLLDEILQGYNFFYHYKHLNVARARFKRIRVSLEDNEIELKLLSPHPYFGNQEAKIEVYDKTWNLVTPDSIDKFKIELNWLIKIAYGEWEN